MGIPCVILLVLPKSSSAKTAAHPTARIFALDFCADDESLLTQAEEDKEKYKQKDCCGAVGVRFPAALGDFMNFFKKNNDSIKKF